MLKLFLLALIFILVWLGVIPVRYWLSRAKIRIQEKKFRLIIKIVTLFEIVQDIIG